MKILFTALFGLTTILFLSSCGDTSSYETNEHLGSLPSIAKEIDTKLDNRELTKEEKKEIKKEGKENFQKELNELGGTFNIPVETSSEIENFKFVEATVVEMQDWGTVKIEYKAIAQKDLPKDWYKFWSLSFDKEGNQIKSNSGQAYLDNQQSFEKGDEVIFKGNMNVSNHEDFDKLVISPR